MPQNSPYYDHLVNAADVCVNCFRQIRLERDQCETTTNQPVSVRLSAMTREPNTTNIEYPGVGDNPTQSQAVFCECGVESSHDRLWDPTDVKRDRFKELLKAALRTVAAKGVTLRRKETAMYCLSHFDDHGDADRALANGLDAGIVAAAASDGQGSGDQLRADGGPTCEHL